MNSQETSLKCLHALHAIVQGRVQGVYYRAWTQETAISLNLKGWVRNLPEGHVEILAEGSKEHLKQLLEKCYSGPTAAQVTEIKVAWKAGEGVFEGFEIRY